MFKKKSVLLLISIAILAAVSIVGCGNKTTQDSVSNQPTDQQASSQVNNGIAMPSEQPAYIGKVSDVANGQITIYKAELPAQNQSVPQGTSPEPPQGNMQGANPELPQGDLQGAPQGDNQKGPGQTTTITVPSSAQVVTGNTRGGNTSAISVSDIKKDQVIQVWEKDGVITFVQVMERNQNDGAQKPQGNNN